MGGEMRAFEGTEGDQAKVSKSDWRFSNWHRQVLSSIFLHGLISTLEAPTKIILGSPKKFFADLLIETEKKYSKWADG